MYMYPVQSVQYQVLVQYIATCTYCSTSSFSANATPKMGMEIGMAVRQRDENDRTSRSSSEARGAPDSRSTDA